MKVKLENISLKFENQIVLDNLELTLPSGKLSCLLGKSGGGKTSLLKIIAGISSKFSGKIIFDGEEITYLRPQNRYVGWVPQQQLIFPNLDVEGNIEYGLITRKVQREIRKKKVLEMAKLVGLQNMLQRDPQGLSGGERQRVALARALAPEPRLLLTDEPFSSLDAPERERLALDFKEVQITTGVTTLHVTHSPREAEIISDVTHILSKGKIVQGGSYSILKKNPVSVDVAKILSIPNVILPGELLNYDYPFKIPRKSILLSKGSMRGKIIAKTEESIFISLRGITIEALNLKGDYSIGQNVNLEIREDEIIRLK